MERKCTLSDVLFYSMDGLHATYVILRVELDQTVRKGVMAEAFRHACRRFPYYRTRLQKLVSGFALVPNGNAPVLHEDPPGYILNAAENNGFLCRFSVWENTVTFSFFHGLTDGAGAIAFLKVILAEYYALQGEAVVPPQDLYDIGAQPAPEETEEPLDAVPADVVPAPYTGSTFYRLPEKAGKETVAYIFTADAGRMMQFASASDGSPNAIAAIAMAKAIARLHPDAVQTGIDVGISINAKPILGLPLSHWPFLQTSTFHFDARAMSMEEELLHTCVRGKVFADCTEQKLYPALAGVRSLGAIFDYIRDDRARQLLCLKSTETPRATATVSYAGASDFGSMGEHIRGLYSFCDAVAPTLEINYNNGVFYFSLSSRTDAGAYAEQIREIFREKGIPCSEVKRVCFDRAKGKQDRPRFGPNPATLRLIAGIRAYKKGAKRDDPE